MAMSPMLIMTVFDMENVITKPRFLNAEHLEFLDRLRLSGVTNMYGVVPYIREEFPELSRHEAQTLFSYWMKTFSARTGE